MKKRFLILCLVLLLSTVVMGVYADELEEAENKIQEIADKISQVALIIGGGLLAIGIVIIGLQVMITKDPQKIYEYTEKFKYLILGLALVVLAGFITRIVLWIIG